MAQKLMTDFVAHWSLFLFLIGEILGLTSGLDRLL